jgi:MOSC domain-containing protein YiiM
MARLLAVNVGLPPNVRWRDEVVHTGIWKHPVQGRCKARRLNLDGDGQGDLNGHGGEQRAVMVYQRESYRYWERTLGRNDFSFGQFGENLTVDGLPDDEVCISDRYRIGSAVFEVTQPPRDLLPRRDSDERCPNARAPRLASPTGILLPA